MKQKYPGLLIPKGPKCFSFSNAAKATELPVSWLEVNCIGEGIYKRKSSSCIPVASDKIFGNKLMGKRPFVNWTKKFWLFETSSKPWVCDTEESRNGRCWEERCSNDGVAFCKFAKISSKCRFFYLKKKKFAHVCVLFLPSASLSRATTACCISSLICASYASKAVGYVVSVKSWTISESHCFDLFFNFRRWLSYLCSIVAYPALWWALGPGALGWSTTPVLFFGTFPNQCSPVERILWPSVHST